MNRVKKTAAKRPQPRIERLQAHEMTKITGGMMAKQEGCAGGMTGCTSTKGTCCCTCSC